MSSKRSGTFADAIVFIFLLMLALNAYTPLMMDDYDYSFSWATGERLAGVGDIFASQWAHYAIWGGRSVTHFLAQLFLYLGKPVFNIANALMYVLLLLEICMLGCCRGEKISWKAMLAAHALLFFLVPFFGVTFLWLDGACNYLWGTALALLPLLIAKSEREGGFFDADRKRGLLATLVCLIAGWTNENTACGVLAVTVLLLIYDRLAKRRVRPWRVGAAAAQALGVTLMLLAPGNFVRPSGADSKGLIADLLYRFAVVSYCLLLYAGVIALLIFIALIVSRKRGAALPCEWLCVLGAGAFLSAYALVGSPQISDRSFTGVIALAIAVLLSLAGVLLRVAPLPKKAARMACAALIALCVLGGVSAVLDVKTHGDAWRAQTARIEAAAAAGEEEITVSSVPSVSRFTMGVLLEESPDAWPNRTISKYFGVRICGEAAEEK